MNMTSYGPGCCGGLRVREYDQLQPRLLRGIEGV